MSDSFATLWTVACQAPLPLEFPRQATGVSCHFLLQRIFLTQGSNLSLLHCRWILYHWTTREAQWRVLQQLEITSTLSRIIYWAPGYRDVCTYPSAFITEGNIADMVRACLWSRELLFLIPWSLLCMLLLYKNIWQSTHSCLELGGVWTLNGINI